MPATPHLAKRYRTLAGDLAVLHASTNPRRRPPRTPIEHALGVRPRDPDAGEEWDRLAGYACRLATDIVAAHLVRGGGSLGHCSPWLIAYLRGKADMGQLAKDDGTLVERVEAIRRWRNEHGVVDGDVRLLGPPPTDPDDRARYDAAQCRVDPAQHAPIHVLHGR